MSPGFETMGNCECLSLRGCLKGSQEDHNGLVLSAVVVAGESDYDPCDLLSSITQVMVY